MSSLSNSNCIVTVDDCIKALLNEDLSYIDANRPWGVKCSEIFTYGISWAQGNQLDFIARKFLGIERNIYVNGSPFDESDVDFRSRIEKHAFRLDIPNPPSIKTCQHKWRVYNGLYQTFEFCEICDEKKV